MNDDREIILTEQLKYLSEQLKEVAIDVKTIKDVQGQKISDLEKDIAIIKEKIDKHEWFYKIALGTVLLAIIGAILSLIIKK